MPVAHLTDRAVICIAGEDATSFLSGLVTCAVESREGARYGALLTPQGKVIADFFLLFRGEAGGRFFLDAPRLVAEPLLKRLAMYKLRAKVTLSDVSGNSGVFAAWGGGSSAFSGSSGFTDPRLDAMGSRAVLPLAAAPSCDGSLADYDAHRIGLAVPQGGRDFAYGDAFPHEAAMDELAGVDFHKGCYVGQEVVSRMQHRGTARTRMAALRFSGPAPSEGAEIKAGDKPMGRVGSVDAGNSRGIGLLRLDRLADALAAGNALHAGETVLHAEKPGWARYAFPMNAVQETK